MNKPIIRMSEAGACPRALSAQLLGYPSEPAPDWLERAAEEGRWHEERMVQELKEGKISFGGYGVISWFIDNRQKEFTLEFPSFFLVGHIEGMAIPRPGEAGKDEGWRLLEIKSMSQYEFDRWMRDRFDGFPEYADQLTCYMEATGLDECLYLVKNRSSGYIDRRIITERPSEMPDLKLASVMRYVEGKLLHPAECDFSTIQCKRCFYKRLCIPAREEMTVQEEKVLLKAAEDWRRGKKLTDEGKELIDSAKEIFEEHTIATGLTKWSLPNLVIAHITVKEHEIPARTQKEYSYIRINDLEKKENSSV